MSFPYLLGPLLCRIFVLLLDLLPCRPFSEHFFFFLLSKEPKWQKSDAPPSFHPSPPPPPQQLLPSPRWPEESPCSQAQKQKDLGHYPPSLWLPILASTGLPPSNRPRSPIHQCHPHLGCPSLAGPGSVTHFRESSLMQMWP